MSRLIVNSLGEVFINNRLIIGSISIPNLTARIGRDPTPEDFTDEFQRQLRESIPEYVHTVSLVWEAQKKFDKDSGFVRIQFYDGALRVTTEFEFSDDETELRDRIYKAASLLKANILIMDEYEQDGRSYTKYDMNVAVWPHTMEAISHAIERVRELWSETGVSVI